MKKSRATSLGEVVMNQEYFTVIVNRRLTNYTIWRDLTIKHSLTGEVIQPTENHLHRPSVQLYVGKSLTAIDVYELYVATFNRDPLTGSQLRWKPIVIDDKMTPWDICDNGFIRSRAAGDILHDQLTDDGYHTVTLNLNDRCYKRSLHRLVALAFVSNPDNKPEVNHKDGDKHNNRWWNLEWVTAKENTAHAITMGLKTYYGGKGVENGRNIYTEDQIRQACKLMEDPSNLPMTISAKTGISKTMLHNIRFKDAWSHISKDYNLYLGKHKTYNPNRNHQVSPMTQKIIEMVAAGKKTAEIISEVDPKREHATSIYTLISKYRKRLAAGSTTIENTIVTEKTGTDGK